MPVSARARRLRSSRSRCQPLRRHVNERSIEVADGAASKQFHGTNDVGAQDLDSPCNSGFSRATKTVSVGATDEDGLRAQAQGPHDITATANTTAQQVCPGSLLSIRMGQSRLPRRCGRADTPDTSFFLMRKILREAGADFKDALRVVYLTDMNDRKKFDPIRQEFFRDARPASTLIGITALALLDLEVEIDAVAGLTGRSGASNCEATSK